MEYKILSINTGASSTKIGLFLNENSLLVGNIAHPYEEIKDIKTVIDNMHYRTNKILNFLKENDVNLKDLSAVSAIGGILRPLIGGTYEINQTMLLELEEGKRLNHASNLAGLIAFEIAANLGIKSYVVDPVSIDEMSDIARFSGCKLFERDSLSHYLNPKAIAKRWAVEHNKDYCNSNLITVHLGSGNSVSAHKNGRVIDTNNSSEEGPFSVERTGSLPCKKLVKMCFSGKYTQEEMEKHIFGEGGIYSYLGIKDYKKVAEMVSSGDKEAIEVVDAMIYQIAKEVGGLTTVLEGKIDAIIITGGMAHDTYLSTKLSQRISFLSKVFIYPGEDELRAIAEGAFRVLSEVEECLQY